MAAILCARLGAVLANIFVLLTLAVYSTYGGCLLPASWTGMWFQSGYQMPLQINATNMFSKGECADTDHYDKFLLYDRGDDCYRCLVIHEKHRYVLQYKETYCSPKDSLSSICEGITGDAPLYSMFRKEPRPVPQPCPFHPAPFTFTYSRGSGDCANPPSRAESCTDDSRMLLRYMACPDVPGTESNLEELVCLATWKEGSTRYLVGLVSQPQRRNTIVSDEDMFRCFVYKGQHTDKIMTYTIAQSGDATCNGLTSPTDGSRTIKLTNIDDEHNRCHFPRWIVQHHKWFSLDHTHSYHFTTKNATLKVMKADGSLEEKRLVCHSILEHKENQHVTLVAHVTKGCESGHVCLRFFHRSSGVVELRWGAGALRESPADACGGEDAPGEFTPYVTLVTTSLQPARCPVPGRYAILGSLADRRRRRQQISTELEEPGETPGVPVCVGGEYSRVEAGCGAGQDKIEFYSDCYSTAYTCYGSWVEDGVGYIVAASADPPPTPHTVKPRTFCFLYTHQLTNDTSLVGVSGAGGMVELVSVSAAARCERALRAGAEGERAYNLTINGTCEQSSKYNSPGTRLTPAAILLTSLASLTSLLAHR